MSFEQPSTEQPSAENDLDAYYEKKRGELIDRVLEKMQGESPEEAKQTLHDALKLYSALDRLAGVGAIEPGGKTNLDLSGFQEGIDEQARKLGLSPEFFSAEKVRDIIAGMKE